MGLARLVTLPPRMRPPTFELLVLHGLRLKGFATADTLANFIDRPADLVERQLNLAADDGYTRVRNGGRPGWSLTDEGRKEGERLLAEELDRTEGLRQVMGGIYRRFLALNGELLQICTDWQVSDIDGGVLNDHGDEAYDAAVIDRLAAVDVQVQPVCTDLAQALDRFAHYGPRLTAALAHVAGGDTEWFTKPTIDSYHTVWFELHEDLLATLGLDRTSERDHHDRHHHAAEDHLGPQDHTQQ